jgi:hypothetical protein
MTLEEVYRLLKADEELLRAFITVAKEYFQQDCLRSGFLHNDDDTAFRMLIHFAESRKGAN